MTLCLLPCSVTISPLVLPEVPLPLWLDGGLPPIDRPTDRFLPGPCSCRPRSRASELCVYLHLTTFIESRYFCLLCTSLPNLDSSLPIRSHRLLLEPTVQFLKPTTKFSLPLKDSAVTCACQNYDSSKSDRRYNPDGTRGVLVCHPRDVYRQFTYNRQDLSF